MYNLKNIFSPKANRKIEVQMLRSCFVNQQQFIEGDTVTFDEKTALELVAQGAARDLKGELVAQNKAQSLAELVPALGEPRPLPEGWQHLPECFTLYWHRRESGKILFDRRDAIEQKLIALVSNKTMPSFKGLSQLTSEQTAKYFNGFTLGIGEDSPEEVAVKAHLRDAYERAVDVGKDWLAANRLEVARLSIACGDHVFDKHGELCRNVRELHALAKELFGVRIAALGLSQHKVNELFTGSADANKYASIEAPGLSDRRLAWADEGQDPKLYLDTPVDNMAAMIFKWSGISAEVASLTKQCKAELAKASKVAA